MINLCTLKALADETRWKILHHLSENQYCVCALSNIIGISQSAISQHLKILREANLVIGEKRGYYTHYVIQPALIKETAQSLIYFSEKIRAERCEVNCPLTDNKQEEEMKKKKCLKPEHLKTEPRQCSPEQIKECHGDSQNHECEDTKCQQPEHLKGKPAECSPEQIKKCHGNNKDHQCV